MCLAAHDSWLNFAKFLDIKVIKSIEKGDLFVAIVSKWRKFLYITLQNIFLKTLFKLFKLA